MKDFTENYFNKKGDMVGSDCYDCGKRVNLQRPHEVIPGPIYYFAHKKCIKRFKEKTKAL